MSKCTKCSKRIGLISIRYKCRQCKRIFCSNCMAKVNIPSEMIPLFELINEFEKPEYSLTKLSYVFCPNCATAFNNAKEKLRIAMRNKYNVELVSKNYKGKKRYDKSYVKKIESHFNKDKEDSEEEIRILANYYDCDMVLEVEIIKDQESKETDSGGTYIYNVWKYKGYAVRKIY